MIINENLYQGQDVVLEALNVKYRSKIIKIPQNLEEGQEYTISFFVEQSLNGSGQLNVVVKDSTNTSNIAWWVAKGNSKFKETFIFQRDQTALIMLFSDIVGKTNNIAASFKKIKLEKGDTATQYIPNVNDIEPSKQAVFLAGGAFREVYPI